MSARAMTPIPALRCQPPPCPSPPGPSPYAPLPISLCSSPPSAPSPCLSKVGAQGPQKTLVGVPLPKATPHCKDCAPPTQLSLPTKARMTAGAPHGALSPPHPLLS